MIAAILGQKLSQSQRFSDKGERIPVTLIEAGPCTVVQIKTRGKDGYTAIQLGFSTKKTKNFTKPILGHFKKAGLTDTPRFLKEIRLLNGQEADGSLKAGKVIHVADVLKAGDVVQVTGVSKGKGFAGVVKRYRFRGGPRTHGQSDRERAPGSIGQTTTPGRVHKGKRMAGRMGTDTVTVKNLKVIEVDKEKNLLVLKGLVPGAKNSLVKIVKS